MTHKPTTKPHGPSSASSTEDASVSGANESVGASVSSELEGQTLLDESSDSEEVSDTEGRVVRQLSSAKDSSNSSSSSGLGEGTEAKNLPSPPDTSKPPGTPELEVAESEVRESEARESEVRESEVRESEAPESEVRESEVRESEVRESEVRESEVRESEIREPEIRESDTPESSLLSAASTSQESSHSKETSPPSEPEDGATSGGGMAKAASRFGLATMLSRVLGLVREQLFAALVGAGPQADAFVVAFRIPNLLRDLFAEGALSAAFVPTFTDYLVNRRQKAWILASRVVNLLLLLLGTLVLVATIYSEELVWLLAARFSPDRAALAAKLTRIMLPFLPVVSLSAVAMGMLTAQSRFGAPALAPAAFNTVAIVVGVGLYLAGVEPTTAVIGWSVGTLLGGLAQLLIQLPPLVKTGWKYLPSAGFGVKDEGIRRIARLMGPATIGLAATQFNIVVNTFFASGVVGAAAWLAYAFRLMQLPIGVFGVAVATVATTGFARHAASQHSKGINATMGSGLRLVAFLTVPSTLMLAALAEPIVRLLYERGRFDSADTRATALALMGYTLGLYAYAGVKVAAPAFYALNHARMPLFASLSAVATNVVLNAILFPIFGFAGLAIGTSMGAIANFGVLIVAFRKVGGSLAEEGIWRHLAKITFAAVLSAALALACSRGFESTFGIGGLLLRITSVGASLGIGGVAYLALCHLLKLPELETFVGLIRRRLGR